MSCLGAAPPGETEAGLRLSCRLNPLASKMSPENQVSEAHSLNIEYWSVLPP